MLGVGKHYKTNDLNPVMLMKGEQFFISMAVQTLKEALKQYKIDYLSNDNALKDYKDLKRNLYALECLIRGKEMPKKSYFKYDERIVVGLSVGEYDRLQKTLTSEFLAKYGHIGLCSCRKIYDANKFRKRRLNERFKSMRLHARRNDYKLYFLTMTFSDEFLSRTSPKTRRQKISRFLNEWCVDFAANIDFGESEEHTHREHYHAIGETRDIQALTKAYYKVFGSYLKVKVIPNKEGSKREFGDNEKVSTYMSKLTNHGLKKSTGNCNVVYKRGKIYENVPEWLVGGDDDLL